MKTRRAFEVQIAYFYAMYEITMAQFAKRNRRRLKILVDIFTKRLLMTEPADGLTAEDVLELRTYVAQFRGHPVAVQSGQEPGFTCRVFDHGNYHHGVEPLLIQSSKSNPSAHSEGLNGRFREETLSDAGS